VSIRRGWKPPVDLEDGFLPGCLVRDLSSHVSKAVVRDDLGRAEILEFGGICPGLLRQPDEHPGALQVAVMVGSDVSDE
jgi:hypothetical protein